ncbi:MAG: DEAD/DEAH box helicase family protein, partial [Bacteroidota bacterium]
MDLSSGTIYADIILPLALRQSYTYTVQEEMVAQLQPGLRVEVQFGKNKHYTGIVRRLHGEHPGHKVKPILSLIDLEPVITEKQLQLWEWIASYYACTVGEVMNAGLPSHLKLTSETIITLGPLFSDDATQLDDREYLIVEALTLQSQLTLKDVRDILQIKTVYPVIRRLLDRRIIFLQEELQERYRPKIVRCVRLSEVFQTEEKQVEAFDLVQRSEHQTAVLLEFLQSVRTLPYVRVADLTKRTNAPAAAINAMVKKGIFEFYERQTSRIGGASGDTTSAQDLSDQQIWALAQVRATLEEQKKPALIHGVTGSGKTRVYLELMQEVLAAGGQVLYLLPEIALTGQIVQRLQRVLGDKITVYHSRLNNMERVEIWRAVLAGETSIVGPR